MNETESPEQYCRSIEAYLCRRNDGHLIRIVGPAFEQVCGWAIRGVPLKVAYRGIDRYFERYYAKGPRRRPVRVEFCEADVLDVFDEWRRAVGVPVASAAGEDEGDRTEASAARGRAHNSLPMHLDRVIARLTTLRAGEDRSLDDVLERTVRELDAAKSSAKGLRGDARQLFVERLRALDAALIEAARARCAPPVIANLEADADAELAPFRERMSPEVYAAARRAAVDRLLRERDRLPTISYDA